MNVHSTEAEVLRQVVPQFEARGYDVFLRPRQPPAPGFLGDYVPDAIAMRSDGNVIIEVVRKSREAAERLERLADLLEGQSGWDLHVVWISPTSAPEPVEIQARATMKRRIAEVRDLASGGHTQPAMLLAWATLEALGRALVPKTLERPQPAGVLVEALAHEGWLTPDEAEQVRRFAEKRNRIIHGDLRTRVSKREIADFTGILDLLLTMVGQGAERAAEGV